jgi:hypothetical protein
MGGKGRLAMAMELVGLKIEDQGKGQGEDVGIDLGC